MSIRLHTVEKIGGTSMSNYSSVRENIFQYGDFALNPYNRIFVVSAYGGITDMLLEHKKSGEPGVYARFADAEDDQPWHDALERVSQRMNEINYELFGDSELFNKSTKFINARLEQAQRALIDLQSLCQHGHFGLDAHLTTVREMLASLGEAHSAWNLANLLQKDGINAKFVDLTGWNQEKAVNMDQMVKAAFKDIQLDECLPIVTGYTHSENGLMATFDRGYSEMTFSRIAVLTAAKEAIIHKEYHLSSSDPKLVGEDKVVPIGRTNYDVADQLANLGMEAIHPKAAKGLRQSEIPLRVKNTFEPDHDGTLITWNYVSKTPQVEIIAGRKQVYSVELFDQNMLGSIAQYDTDYLKILRQLKLELITKDVTANSLTHYLAGSLKKTKRLQSLLQEAFPDADVKIRKIALVTALGSDMEKSGMLAKAVNAIAEQDISILAVHQSMRQVAIQFVIDESDYDTAIKALHHHLIENQ